MLASHNVHLHALPGERRGRSGVRKAGLAGIAVAALLAGLVVFGGQTAQAIAVPAVGTISGNITAAANPTVNLVSGTACAYTADTHLPAGCAAANASGNYTIPGLAVGNYKVSFDDYASASSYASEYYDDQPTIGRGTVVQVTSSATTGGINATLTSEGPDATTHLSGSDRFDASAAISAASFGTDVPVAYIANGLKFPDALSGAPVAGKDGAPVLLVNSDAIPTSIADELTRLKPGRIVVLGGLASVSATVESGLQSFTTGAVSRLAGADRFDASAAISAASFPARVPVVYIANGLKFPDALSGAPVAGLKGAPVLLVTADSIPPAIASELLRLQPAEIVVLGGTASISAVVAGQLSTYLYTAPAPQ